MLKYLIVLLSDHSPSICHYNTSNRGNDLLSLEDLKRAIVFGLKQNLLFQVVLPPKPLPEEYYKTLEKVENVQYLPISAETYDLEGCVQISVKNNSFPKEVLLVPISIVNPLQDIEVKLKNLIKDGFQISIVIKDVEKATNKDLENYSQFLNRMVDFFKSHPFSKKDSPFNILTDRLHLRSMNNCEAGISSITLAPDGKFYLCPAFYFDGKDSLDVNEVGIDIPNKHLLKLDYAPICLNCDAYQCRRCIYMNQKGTREINTPTRNQCLISHIERNATRSLASSISWLNKDECFPEITYQDPFEITIRK